LGSIESILRQSSLYCVLKLKEKYTNLSIHAKATLLARVSAYYQNTCSDQGWLKIYRTPSRKKAQWFPYASLHLGVFG